MQFVPYVLDRNQDKVLVSIEPMTENDAAKTDTAPLWQTSWTSDYLTAPRFEKYAAKRDQELLALGALRFWRTP